MQFIIYNKWKENNETILQFIIYNKRKENN